MISALLVVVLTTLLGQTQAVFESNQCLSSYAFYNDTITRCQCSEGYSGLGDLCCDKDDDYYNCNVGGDPWLTTYDGSKAPLNWPCVGRVAVVTGKTRSGSDCLVEVMTTGSFVKNGAVYPDRLVVGFTIGSGGRQLFRIVGNTIQRPGDANPYPSADLYRSRLFRPMISGEMVMLAFSSSRNIWTVSGCSTKVTFRAAQDDAAVQYSRPGVCVSFRKSSSSSPSGDVSNGDLCSASSSNQPSGSVLPYDLLVKLIYDYGSVDADSKAIHPDFRSECSRVEGVVNTCGGKGQGGPSISACAPIMYNAAIKLCMNLMGVTGPEMVGHFADCLRYKCSPDAARCANHVSRSRVLQTCLPQFCDL